MILGVSSFPPAWYAVITSHGSKGNYPVVGWLQCDYVRVFLTESQLHTWPSILGVPVTKDPLDALHLNFMEMYVIYSAAVSVLLVV